MTSLLANSRKRSKAQAIVEFGLALPILLMVMYGLLETGRVIFIYASAVSAARQAVRYGSVSGDNGSGTPYYNDCAGIRAAAKKLGFIQAFKDSDILISYDNGPGAGTPWTQPACPIASAAHPVNGDRIRVQVSTQFTPIVPLVPFKPFTITSAGSRTLLIGVSIAITQPGVVLAPGAGGAMLLTKDATPSSFRHVGDVITYTYTVLNQGSDAITVITVTDDKFGAISCPSSTLAGGASMQCTHTYTITQGDVDAGSVTNTATASALDSLGLPLSSQSTKSINFVPEPQLTLSKDGTAPGVVTVGANITYTFTLQNTGNVALTSPYTISDSNATSWNCNGAVTPLAVGSSTTCTGTHALTNNDINRGYVDNTATATALYPVSGFTVTSNSASAHVVSPELFLSLSASPPSVSALGTTITYTYSLQNRTASSMSNLKIDDSRGASSFPCLLSLAAGQTLTCTRTYSGYSQADMDAGSILNDAHATASGGKRSNDAIDTVTVIQNPQLSLAKAPSTGTALSAGIVITYTYTLRNTGNVTLSAPYAVTDNKVASVNCSGATGTMALQATKTCTGTYTVTTNDLAAGSIINTATATAVFKSQTITSGPANATVITFTGARLGLLKSANPPVFSSVGQTITYTYTLKNTGGVPLTAPYSVTDNLVAGITCPLTPLLVGGSVACTGTYPITPQNDIDGFVTNTAHATAMFGLSVVTSSNPFPTTLTLTRFLCDSSHLYSVTPFPNGADVTWAFANYSGLTLHVTAIKITWSAGPSLIQVFFDGPSIWTGASSSNTGFYVPLGPWAVVSGRNTDLRLKFSASASGVLAQLTFQEAGCGPLDSGNISP